jgi:phage host-nuclease inhibitor protein Gam
MTDTDRIAQMAREAGFSVEENGAINDGIETAADFSEELTRFARLVAEDCAKVADDKAMAIRLLCNEVHVVQAAQAIRARYSTEG